MIWQEGVHVIVMLTNLRESDKVNSIRERTRERDRLSDPASPLGSSSSANVSCKVEGIPQFGFFLIHLLKHLLKFPINKSLSLRIAVIIRRPTTT